MPTDSWLSCSGWCVVVWACVSGFVVRTFGGCVGGLKVWLCKFFGVGC